MLRPLLTLALVAPALLAGCAAPNDVASDDAPRLTMKLDRDAPRDGETMTITVTFENHGDEPFRYDHPGCPPEPFTVEVRGAAGPIRAYTYGEEPMAGACVVTNRTVQPGESFTVAVQWNGHVEERQPEPHGGDRAAAGEYTVRAELRRADEGPRLAVERSIVVEA